MLDARLPSSHSGRRALPFPALLWALALTGLVASTLGCQKQAEPEEAPAVRVENPELGIALADVPAFFRVAKNEGATIELSPADAAVGGLLAVSAATPEVGGVNLVAAIEAHQAELEARPDGVFKGQRELGSQLGTAFYSRGQFSGDGGPQEQTRVFLVHPDGARMLILDYTYPQGEDSSARLMEQLFVVLGEVEPLDTAGGAPAGNEAGAG